jgi:hypothetical protein
MAVCGVDLSHASESGTQDVTLNSP